MAGKRAWVLVDLHIGKPEPECWILIQGALVEDLKMILGIDSGPGLMRIVSSQG